MRYEPHENDDTDRFDDPIKIRWVGYARGRIAEYNYQYQEDPSFDIYSPRQFCKAAGFERQKTNVVIITLGEANSVRYELTNYSSRQRVWMNAMMDNALDRVAQTLDKQMKKRGYEPTWKRAGGLARFTGYKFVEL